MEIKQLILQRFQSINSNYNDPEMIRQSQISIFNLIDSSEKDSGVILNDWIKNINTEVRIRVVPFYKLDKIFKKDPPGFNLIKNDDFIILGPYYWDDILKFIIPETLEEYLIEIQEEFKNVSSKIRYGQAVYTYVTNLYNIFVPDIYDCFYNDSKVDDYILKTYEKLCQLKN